RRLLNAIESAAQSEWLGPLCSTRSRALLRAMAWRLAWSPLLNAIESTAQSEWLVALCSTRSRALLRASGLVPSAQRDREHCSERDTKTLFKAKDSRPRDRHRADCFIVANSFALTKGRALFEASWYNWEWQLLNK
ncbi:hypothetical protein BT67DRAFT_438806, partial [Trichocladium antarcticum]